MLLNYPDVLVLYFLVRFSGPYCKHRHRRRVICPLYLAGFCPRGKECKFTHPSFAIPQYDPKAAGPIRNQSSIVCHNCHERGHKVTNCPHLPNQPRDGGDGSRRPFNSGDFERRNISDVVCYKVSLLLLYTVPGLIFDCAVGRCFQYRLCR